MKISIIGAGVGGLALAPLLAQIGHEVTIFEKNSSPGGRAGQFKTDGFTFDTGPSWLTMPEIFQSWYTQVGHNFDTDLDLTTLDPSYSIFWSDRQVRIPHSFKALEKVYESLEPGSSTALQDYFYYTEKIYTLSMSQVLQRSFTSFLDYLAPSFWSPFVKRRIKFIGNLEQEIYARFQNPYLRQILLYNLAFLGTAPQHTARVYATLNYIDMKWGVLYPRGGMYALVKSMEAIAIENGVKFHYNSPVSKILNKDGETTGLISLDETHQFDIVISNAHREFTEKTLLGRTYRPTSLAPSAVLIFAGMRGKLTNASHHNLFFSDDFAAYYKEVFDLQVTPNDPNFYLAVASSTDASVAPENYENLSWVIPVSAKKRMTNTQLQTFANKIITITEQKLGEKIRDRLLFTEIRAHEYFETSFHAPSGTALGIPNLIKYSGPLRASQTDKKLKGLYYVGADTHPGIGLPMVLLSAMNLAKTIHNLTA